MHLTSLIKFPLVKLQMNSTNKISLKYILLIFYVHKIMKAWPWPSFMDSNLTIKIQPLLMGKTFLWRSYISSLFIYISLKSCLNLKCNFVFCSLVLTFIIYAFSLIISFSYKALFLTGQILIDLNHKKFSIWSNF